MIGKKRTMIRVTYGVVEIRVSKIPWPFPSWVYAFVVWPFIFYEPKAWGEECVQVHERYHWMDQLRWLLLPWFLVYGMLAIFYGGRERHPLEREAYRRQRECETQAQGPT